MMNGTMRQEIIEGIQEAISTGFYDYIQEVTGKERLHRYAMVECVAVNAVRDMIDKWMERDNDTTSTHAFLTDEEQRLQHELQEKVFDRIKTYKKQRFENPGRRCPFSKTAA